MTFFQQKVEEGDPKALFLQEQLALINARRCRWREETVRMCVLWQAKSPCGYNLLRETGVLSLPGRSTLKRYIGACTGQVVSSLMKQRLHMEAKLHCDQVKRRTFFRKRVITPEYQYFQARCGSLVMDEMAIKQSSSYQRQADEVHGFVDLGGAEVEFGLDGQLATHLLCFVFVGLSTHYRLVAISASQEKLKYSSEPSAVAYEYICFPDCLWGTTSQKL